MSNFSSNSISCRNWSPNYSVLVSLNKASEERVGGVPHFWAKWGYSHLNSDLLRTMGGGSPRREPITHTGIRTDSALMIGAIFDKSVAWAVGNITPGYVPWGPTCSCVCAAGSWPSWRLGEERWLVACIWKTPTVRSRLSCRCPSKRDRLGLPFIRHIFLSSPWRKNN
jgi:hypothetical protein